MAKKLKKITTYEASDREILKSNTPAVLPDNPSDHKWSAKQIKATMYKGILLLYDWFSKSVDEIDVILEDNGNTLINHQNFLERLDQLKKANLDGLSRVIHETYATIEALSQETNIRNTTDIALNEAIAVNKAVLDNIVNGTTSVPKATLSNKATNDTYGNEIKVDNYIASIEFNYDSNNASLLLVAKDQNGVVKSRKELVLPKETFLNNGYYDNETHEIVLVLNNNNTIRFSASDLVDTYSGDNTDGQIETVVDGRTIKARLKNGSVTRNHLSPDIVSVWGEYEANEQSRITAEQLRATAEINRVNAETTRATNESTRQSQEATRQNNENTRDSNETTRQENEVLRQSQETNRQENETTRSTNEQARVSAESTRESNETTRTNNEEVRANAELVREQNEATRGSNENTRVSYEETRNSNEETRLQNEIIRENNELLRQQNESNRVNKADIVDNLTSEDETKVLSAKQGKVLKNLIDAINAVLSSDDTDLDTIQELVNNIKANKTTIDSIVTSKVNVTDIVDNLTSTETNKPLSANQGKILDEKIATANTNITNAINTAKGYTDGEIAGLSNVYQPIGNYQPTGDYVTTTTFNTYKTSNTNDLANKVAFTDVVNATTNGVCPAYSNANSSSTDITSTQYVLTNDGKWHKLPSTAFSDHTSELNNKVNAKVGEDSYYTSIATSFVGGVHTGPWSNNWDFLIRAQHRNGTGDGNNYIMEIASSLISDGNVAWRKKYGGSSFTGWRTFIDSNNKGDYFTQAYITSQLGLGTANNNTTWGTIKATNGYTIRWGSDQPSGGGLVIGEKDGKTSIQIDGDFYANEGEKKVVKNNDIPTFNGLQVAGRVYGSGDDEGIVVGDAGNGYAGITLGTAEGERTTFYHIFNDKTTKIRQQFDGTTYDIFVPKANGTLALTDDIPTISTGTTTIENIIMSGIYNKPSFNAWYTGTETGSNQFFNYGPLIFCRYGSNYKAFYINYNGSITTLSSSQTVNYSYYG